MAEIVHVIKDLADPDWHGWDLIDENGKWLGNCDTLRQLRFIYNVSLHRGLHPTKTGGVDYLQGYNPYWWRVYWYEQE